MREELLYIYVTFETLRAIHQNYIFSMDLASKMQHKETDLDISYVT